MKNRYRNLVMWMYVGGAIELFLIPAFFMIANAIGQSDSEKTIRLFLAFLYL